MADADERYRGSAVVADDEAAGIVRTARQTEQEARQAAARASARLVGLQRRSLALHRAVAAEQERELLQRLIDTVPVMIVMYHPSTRILHLNREFERRAGWTTEEARQIDLMAACYPDPAQRERAQHFMQSLQEGWMDIELTTKEGRVLQTSWANIRLSDDTQVGIGIDITERKRAEEERARYLAQIEELNTRLQRTVAESHHRIKNNLQMLSAIIDVETADSPETMPISAFHRLGQQVRALAALHDLLTLHSKGVSELDTVSVKATLNRLLLMWRRVVGDRRILARIEDARLNLKQAGAFTLLVNELLSNAVKHGRGEIELVLSVGSGEGSDAAGRGAVVRLEVCDDGPGFPEGFAPEKAANTGLELIESMGRWDLQGEISYENRIEGGARVAVTFSLSEEPMEASEVEQRG